MRKRNKDLQRAEGDLVDPHEVPELVAERLGFRCPHCESYTNAYQSICPQCGVINILISTPGEKT